MQRVANISRRIGWPKCLTKDDLFLFIYLSTHLRLVSWYYSKSYFHVFIIAIPDTLIVFNLIYDGNFVKTLEDLCLKFTNCGYYRFKIRKFIFDRLF